MIRLLLAMLPLVTACKARKQPPVEVPIQKPAGEPMAATMSATWLRDLPAPSDAKPRSVGGPKIMAGPYEDLLGSFEVDSTGEVFVVDSKREEKLQEIVVQPADGPPRALVRTQRLPGPFTEELFDVVIDSTNLYFASNVRMPDAAKVAYAVRAVPKAGGPARILVRRDLAADGLATDLLIDDAALYLLMQGDEPGADRYAASVARIPKAGGDPVHVATNIRGHYPFAIDDEFLYYEAQQPQPAGSALRPGQLVRVPKAGGAAQNIASTADSVGKIVVDKDYVIYTMQADRLMAIYRVPKAGGAPEELARFDGFPTGIAIDGGVVYWLVLAEQLQAPAQLFARTFSGFSIAKMPRARNTGVKLPRAAHWLVDRATLYVSVSNGVERKPI